MPTLTERWMLPLLPLGFRLVHGRIFNEINSQLSRWYSEEDKSRLFSSKSDTPWFDLQLMLIWLPAACYANVWSMYQVCSVCEVPISCTRYGWCAWHQLHVPSTVSVHDTSFMYQVWLVCKTPTSCTRYDQCVRHQLSPFWYTWLWYISKHI